MAFGFKGLYFCSPNNLFLIILVTQQDQLYVSLLSKKYFIYQFYIQMLQK